MIGRRGEKRMLPSRARIWKCGRATNGPFTYERLVEMRNANPDFTTEELVFALMCEAHRKQFPLPIQ